MKKILYFLKENLDITLKEAKSTLAFLIAAFLSLTSYLIVDRCTTTRHAEATIKKFETVSPPSRENPHSYTESAKVSPSEHKRFRFDPNTATRDELMSLGIPAYVANTITNYRNKGGKFVYKTDLQKIYSLKPELYASLLPWIELPERKSLPEREEYRAETAQMNTFEVRKEPETKSPERTSTKFDINLADTRELKKLKGIGSVYASRIVKFRDGLGGFHSLNQLDETFGISPEALTELKKYALIQSGVKTIRINETDNFRHTYLKAAQIRAIVAYRNQHGKFESAEDLKKIKVLTDETIQKITPYLSFE